MKAIEISQFGGPEVLTARPSARTRSRSPAKC